MCNQEAHDQENAIFENNEKAEIYESKTLFKQSNEIAIRHQDQLYRIRITRNGKLIMNK